MIVPHTATPPGPASTPDAPPGRRARTPAYGGSEGGSMAFDAFALIPAMLALGMAMGRTTLLPDNASEGLNLVALYVCLPAAVLQYVPRLQLEWSLLGLALTPSILMGATWLPGAL